MRSALISVLLLAGCCPALAAEEDRDAILRSGLSLAGQGRWPEAKREFEAGIRAFPDDKRFLVELGGVAYRMGSREEALKYFRQAAALDPDDAYANEAAGSISLLEGDINAAVFYWNRAGLPRVAHLDVSPTPRISPRLTARAVKIQPGGVLRLSALETSRYNLERLGVKSVQTEIVASADQSYDLKVGLASGGDWLHGPARLAPLAAQLPYQMIDYEFRVLPEAAGRVDATIRWDSEKRLVRTRFTAVPGGDPRWRFRIEGAGRDENWDVRSSLPSDMYFRFRQAGLGAEINRGFGNKFDFTSGVSFSTRDFSQLSRNAPDDLFTNGLLVKQTNEFLYRALRPASKSIALTFGARETAGRVVSTSGGFAKIEFSAQLQTSIRKETMFEAGAYTGKAFGTTPFDELFQVGMERDNSLWLRGHVGTYNGRKGNSPFGSAYTLFQSDLMHTVFRKPFFSVSAGPFVDTGTISPVAGRFGSNGWLLDVGAESRVKLLRGVTLVVVWGTDTRTGSQVFYTAVRK